MQNFYFPQQHKITQIKDLSPDTKLFRLTPGLDYFNPGQFLMVSVFGFGEGAFSICSSPFDEEYFEIAVRNVGKLTQALHQLEKNELVGIRGPFGNGYSMNKLRKKNITLISGGCGLAPLRSIIGYIGRYRSIFGNLQILVGAKNPKDLLFKDEMKKWKSFAEVITTVEKTTKSWHGNTGLVTNLVTPSIINTKNSTLILCGPPIMYKFVMEKLLKMGIDKKNILASLERTMKCGIGVCQRCTCGEKYICLDGPVFSYEEIKKYQLI